MGRPRRAKAAQLHYVLRFHPEVWTQTSEGMLVPSISGNSHVRLDVTDTQLLC